ncbi:hypothetical protein EYV94_17320 [Puteibacter caeruleilacunae]|nr:hypothetical protein EYV94_17320 [Puteibacter caeruleilacunae]
MKIKVLFLALLATMFVACSDDDDDLPVEPTPQKDGVIESLTDPDMDASDLKGNVTGNITLSAGVDYLLSGPLHVKSGATLKIEPGTTIKAKVGGTDVYIAIEQGAKIDAKGTASKPIVVTSAASNPRAGDWGGLMLIGKAPINKGATATTEVVSLTYGGNVSDDNSGVLEYVRLEYTGARINQDKEFNGFTFYSVGSGTTINNIAVFHGDDDGVEFFGGTAEVSNVLIVNAKDDMFDWTDGWAGRATNVYGVRESGYTDVSEDPRGIEGDSNSSDNDADPRSNPTIDKITIVHNAKVEMADMIKVRRGSSAIITNAFVQLGDDATASDFIDLTDGKGNAHSSTSITVVGDNIDITDNKNESGATINATAGTTGGADFSVFAWTNYTVQ